MKFLHGSSNHHHVGILDRVAPLRTRNFFLSVCQPRCVLGSGVSCEKFSEIAISKKRGCRPEQNGKNRQSKNNPAENFSFLSGNFYLANRDEREYGYENMRRNNPQPLKQAAYTCLINTLIQYHVLHRGTNSFLRRMYAGACKIRVICHTGPFRT